MLIFRRVGGVVVVVGNQKTLRIRHMQLAHVLHQGLSRHTFLFGLNHGGRAVGVVGADVDRLIAAHALKSHPNIGLDLL